MKVLSLELAAENTRLWHLRSTKEFQLKLKYLCANVVVGLDSMVYFFMVYFT